VAFVRRRLRHDAGDDVRHTGVPRRRRHDAGHRATDALGQPDPDPAGDPVFVRALLCQRVARPQAAPGRHGRAGGARRRRGLCGERLGNADCGGRGVFRFGDDVRLLPAHRPLPGNDGTAEGGAQRGNAGAGHSGVRHPPGGLAGRQLRSGRRARCGGRIARRRRGAGQAGRDGAGRRIRARW
jgi:hypothetical protein